MQQHLGIIGGGVMGAGIAALALSWGRSVALVEVDKAALDRSRRNIAAHVRHAQLMGTPPDRPRGELVTATDLSALAGAAAVVEAVTAPAPQKAKVLADAPAARDELLSRGVAASELMTFSPQDGGTFFGFADPDGNTWAVQELRVRGERPLIPVESRGRFGA